MGMELKLSLGLESPAEDEIIKYRLSEDDFEVAKDTNIEERQKLLETLETQCIEPTEEQSRLIESIDRNFTNVFDKYNISYPPSKYPETFFLSAANFKKLDIEEKGKVAGKKPWPDIAGFYLPEKDAVVVWYRKAPWSKNENNEEFVHTVSHELLHANAFRSLQAFKKEGADKPAVDTHRSGFQIVKLGQPDKVLFHDLNEAITETLAAEVTSNVIKSENELFGAAIKEQIEKEIRRSLKPGPKTSKGAEKTNPSREMAISKGYDFKIPAFYEWLDKKYSFMDFHERMRGNNKFKNEKLQEYEEEVKSLPGFQQNQVIVEDIFKKDQFEYKYKDLVYSPERKLFGRLIDALSKNRPELEGKFDEIKSIFYNAYFNGSMQKIGRLIDETFGRGTFRLVAENAKIDGIDHKSEELRKRLRAWNKKKMGYHKPVYN
ncbi:MAG: hypothetical protein Q8P07_04885 [bacterium]|nr:hypothetical protein [bacterium]